MSVASDVNMADTRLPPLAVVVGADRDRAHGEQRFVRHAAVALQVAAEGAADQPQHHVVHRDGRSGS